MGDRVICCPFYSYQNMYNLCVNKLYNSHNLWLKSVYLHIINIKRHEKGREN